MGTAGNLGVAVQRFRVQRSGLRAKKALKGIEVPKSSLSMVIF